MPGGLAPPRGAGGTRQRIAAVPDPESFGRRRTATFGAPRASQPGSGTAGHATAFPGGGPRRSQTPSGAASAHRRARRRRRPLSDNRRPCASLPSGRREFVPSRREDPTRQPDSRRFSAQSRSTAPSIVPPKPEMVREPGLRVCIHLPTSPFGTVPTSRMPTTLATHAPPLPTPAHRGAVRRASVAGARERIRQARPPVADRRP